MKILVVDDHGLMLDGLRETIALLDPSFKITVAMGVAEALALVDEHEFGFVLSDLRFGTQKTGGFDIISACDERGIRCAIISGDVNSQLVAEAAKRGASAYFDKACLTSVLASLLILVIHGRTTYAPMVTDESERDLVSRSELDSMDEMTLRIMDLRCEDESKSNKVLGRDVNLGEDSIKRYLGKVNLLLRVPNRAEALKRYRQLRSEVAVTSSRKQSPTASISL